MQEMLEAIKPWVCVFKTEEEAGTFVLTKAVKKEEDKDKDKDGEGSSDDNSNNNTNNHKNRKSNEHKNTHDNKTVTMGEVKEMLARMSVSVNFNP